MNKYTEKGRTDSDSSIIRGVLDDVEQYARFQAPRLLNCYQDLLHQHLVGLGLMALAAEVTDLRPALEFGVTGQTRLSLLGLGLSRSSVLAISELIASDDLNQIDCLAWLSQRDWDTTEVTELVKREVDNTLQTRGL